MSSRVLRWASAALLLAASSCVGVLAAPPAALMVSTSIEPIVAKGAVNNAWLPPNVGGAGPYDTTQVEFPRYQIMLDNTTTQTQGFTLTYSSTDLTVLTTDQGTESGVASNVAYSSTTRTQCAGAGTAIILVTMTFVNPLADSLSWEFKHTCVVPLIQIGLKPWDQDVVDSTVTGSPVESATMQNYILTENTLNLYLSLANQLPQLGGKHVVAPFAVGVVSSDETSVTVASITYNATWAPVLDTWNYAIFDTSQPLSVLTIQFTCLDTATSQTGIAIVLDYSWQTPLEIVLTKQCYTAPILTDLSIGSLPNSTDIAAGGVVTQAWQGPQGYVYKADEIFDYVFDFFMCLGCQPSTGTTPSSAVFNISYDNQGAEIFDLFFEGAMDSISSGVLTLGQSSPFRAHVQCKSNGTGTTFWQADFGSSYQMVQFAFTYTCVFPFLDFVYGAGPTATKGGVIVAKDTQVVPSFSDFTFTIPAEESVSLFYMYLDSIDKYQTLPHQFYALSFNADGTAMVPPEVFDPNYGSAPLLHPNYDPIQVTWLCLKNVDHVAVTMSVRYGWGSTMEVHFFKNCVVGAPDNGNGGGGGGGWSGAGIFFFVLFLILLAFFVGGTAYNCKEGKRGWAAVPLYEPCVKCVDRVKGGGNQHWTPQMETAGGARAPSSTSYGNFDDRGDSYQSNL